VKLTHSKRRLAIAAFILLALFLIRPGASRLKSRIIFSISRALGRPVDIGAVHIELLPWPGFDLDDLVVYDDPAFGAEPMLRAREVTATLRLASLLRGRLEIARLELTEPSLNLVHLETGRWNVESLLERSAHSSLAPTAKTKLEPRPGFPYIVGTSGRINFKNGSEKRPYAFTNADFSLWQDSENAWGARLKAQPFRSDMNLNDTGLLQATGTWQRAEITANTPLQVSVEWSHAQVGQLTKFVTGMDQGWRGALLLEVAFEGTPAELKIRGTASVDDFRRYDLTSGQALRMTANCDAEYHSMTHEFHKVMCNAPAGTGWITLTGDMGWPGSQRYSLALVAENVPANALAMLAKRVKKNLPDDLAAEGTLHATLAIHEDGERKSRVHWQGRGEVVNFQLTSASNKAEVGPETLPFFLTDQHAGRTVVNGGPSLRFPADAHLEIGPFGLGTGRSSDPLARGWISRAGYRFVVQGDAEVERTLRLGRMLGIPAAATAAAQGAAKLDLSVAGAWRGQGDTSAAFIGPQIAGSAKLRNVQINVRGLGGPVEIDSADMQLSPDGVRLDHLNARAATALWSGTLALQRGCRASEACPVHFALKANQLSLANLNEWIHPPNKTPWYRALAPMSATEASAFSSVHASGQIAVDRFQLATVQASHVSARVDLNDGKLEVSALQADLLDGQIRGEWNLDFGAKPAVCKGSGKFLDISLTSLARLMNDEWVEGRANADYEIASTCSSDFWSSAGGTVRVDVRNGILPHLFVAEDQQPLRVTRLSGQGQLRSGKIEIKNANLRSPDGTYQLSGTASLNRELDLKLTHGSNGANMGYTVKGTLSEPLITQLTAVQARLKQ